MAARSWPAVGGRGILTYIHLPNRGDTRRPERVGQKHPNDIEDRPLMKIAPWYLAALAPFAAIGYSGAHLGHAVVVLLTVGIFLGTLTMQSTRVLPGPKTDP